MTATEPDRAFDELVGELDYPMLLVTAAAGGERDGCLVGFGTQCSISPPRFVVYLSEKNRTFALASEAEALGVHFLTADDRDLAELFGGETGEDVDKFAAVEWLEGPAGAPLVKRCTNRFVGRVIARHEPGDHVGFVLEPIDAESTEGFQSLSFQVVKRIEPGHKP